MKKNIFISGIAFVFFILFISGCTNNPVKKCGDGICDAQEKANPSICPKDCPKPSGSVCGDKICQSGEETTCPKDCKQPSKPLCGNGKCDTGEETTCPKDCTPETEPVCGNDNCESGESCSSCSADCGSCPVTGGESRFGIHVGRLDLKSEISELGDIYSRINLGDAFGWKPVKGSGASRSQCMACCDSSRSTCGCTAGFYYCSPDNRENVIGKDIADGFYADNYQILFII